MGIPHGGGIHSRDSPPPSRLSVAEHHHAAPRFLTAHHHVSWGQSVFLYSAYRHDTRSLPAIRHPSSFPLSFILFSTKGEANQPSAATNCKDLTQGVIKFPLYRGQERTHLLAVLLLHVLRLRSLRPPCLTPIGV